MLKVVKQRILAAFMSRNDALSQAMLMSTFPDSKSKNKFWESFKRAHEIMLKTPITSLPPPQLTTLSKTASRHINLIEHSDSFQLHFGGMQYSFQNVNLEALQPVQMFVNLEPHLETPPTKKLKDILNYCLPLDVSVSSEFLLTQTGIRCITSRYGMGSNNVIRKTQGNNISLSIEHPNYIQVARFNCPDNSGNIVDRMIILNGTHRAFELLKAGHVQAPAMVFPVTSLAALPIQIPQGQGFFSLDYMLHSPRPALISDFFGQLAVDSFGLVASSILDITIGTQKVQ
jgi:hypothetical protein